MLPPLRKVPNLPITSKWLSWIQGFVLDKKIEHQGRFRFVSANRNYIDHGFELLQVYWTQKYINIKDGHLLRIIFYDSF